MLELLYCGHIGDTAAMGRAVDLKTGWQMCKACAAYIELNDMVRTGVAGLYLTTPPLAADQMRSTNYRVTDWLGGLCFPVFNYKHSKHGGGFGAQREDFDFKGPDGFIWHGVVRGDMQLARCKRTKRKAK